MGFLAYLVVCSLPYHFYHQTSYRALANLAPLSHSTINTVQRVMIIVAALAMFRNPITLQARGRGGGGG